MYRDTISQQFETRHSFLIVNKMLQSHQLPKFATHSWDVPIVLDLEVQHLVNFLEGPGSGSHLNKLT